jgi:hypothetical protein
MLSVYPFGSGSLYTASYAVTASCAVSASFIKSVVSASTAGLVLFPQSGSRGKGVCIITAAQYVSLQAGKLDGYVEICNFD